MSVQAVAWALEEAPVDCPTCLLVLIGLANHADDQWRAFPSVSTLARYCRCSPRTVQRHLRDLEELELLEAAWHPRLAQLPADRRPTAYRILVTSPRGDRLTPRDADGVTPVTRRGDRAVTPRGDTRVTRTVKNHQEPSGRPRGDTADTPAPPVGMFTDDQGRAWVSA